MYTREPRIREAYLQPDGRLRLTIELYGRALPVRFTTPTLEELDAPDAERAIDLDGGADDARARFTAETFAALVDMRYRAGRLADDVDDLGDWPSPKGDIVMCSFGAGLLR